jgi:DnaK suppressor protein
MIKLWLRLATVPVILTNAETLVLARVPAAPYMRGPNEGRSSRGKRNVWKTESGHVLSEGGNLGRVGMGQVDEAYVPSEDEPFMNERQREHFRKKLLAWKQDILAESRETLEALQADSHNHPDIADRASSETDRSIELRARDRQRKLIAKIEAALRRIEDGTYGYCEETGEPISLRRLEARPIATLSVEAQERHERRERIYRDD